MSERNYNLLDEGYSGRKIYRICRSKTMHTLQLEVEDS